MARLQFQYPGQPGLSLWQNLTGSSDLRVRSSGSQWWRRLRGGPGFLSSPRRCLWDAFGISQAKSTASGELAPGAWFCLNGVANVLPPVGPLCGWRRPPALPHTPMLSTPFSRKRAAPCDLSDPSLSPFFRAPPPSPVLHPSSPPASLFLSVLTRAPGRLPYTKGSATVVTNTDTHTQFVACFFFFPFLQSQRLLNKAADHSQLQQTQLPSVCNT